MPGIHAETQKASEPRVIAVDWSGDLTGGARTIWLCEIAGGEVVRLESGRSRQQVVEELIRGALANPSLVVGLDFAFAFPRWFHERLGVFDSGALWKHVAQNGEEWLRACNAPFWGKPGRTKPAIPAEFRRTEAAAAGRDGAQPKSVFQVGGAGAVGTGSIRGMPFLLRLRDAGFSVWPFDAPALPMVVEIYPRILTGAVVKSNGMARATYLATRHAHLTRAIMSLGANNEDAFDALVSALAMAAHAGEFSQLTRDEVDQVEGRIWMPDGQ